MKRIFYFLIIIFVLTLSIAICIRPLIIFLAQRQLENVFIASEVSIGKCNLKPMRILTFSDIEIRREPLYKIKAGEIKIEFSLLSLFKKNIRKIHIADTGIFVNVAQRNISEFRKYLNLGSEGVFLLNSLELSNLDLSLTSRDLNTKIKLSTEVNSRKPLITYCDLKIDSLNSPGFQLSDAALKLNSIKSEGSLYVRFVQYDKLKIEEIKSGVKIDERSLSLDSLSARLFNGEIQGDLDLSLEKEAGYSGRLKFINCDLVAFIRDFELGEKIQISGKIEGSAELKGTGVNINVLSGVFSTLNPGGTLIIKDNRFFENMARNPGQSIDILVESFKDYRYNTGVIKIFLEGRNLILEAALEGASGKRNLSITLHDFSL